MSLFKKSPSVGADGYERKTVMGWVHKGKVAKMLTEGWEIERSQPIQIGGTSIDQERFTLKRRAV